MAKRNSIIARGKRLQSLRKKAGLTRLAFAEQTGMSPHTLKALELGERELTPQKALLFSNLFSSLFSVSLGEDVHEASFDFLFHGKIKELPNKDLTFHEIDEERIQKDLEFFEENPSFMLHKIPDDLMAPFYVKDDIVAGRKITNHKQFLHYQGHICILETLNGDKLIRRIIRCNQHTLTVCILNTHTNQFMEVVEELEVRSIAQAIWHWHLSQRVQLP